MEKKMIKLTESDLHRIIESSVKKCIMEIGRFDSDLDADEIYGDRADREYRQSMRDKLFQDDWEMRNRRLRQKYPGKSEEWYEAMIDTFYENKKPRKAINEIGDTPKGNFALNEAGYNYGYSKGMEESCNEESFQNNQNYSHFAVSKKNGKIINGWDYHDYDPSELRQFKKDYFDVDLIDYGFNPKDFRILTYKYLVKNGLNPDDNANWANNDETNSEFVG